MTVFDAPCRARRFAITAALAAGLLIGTAACGQDEPEPAPSSPAPVLGPDSDRVQLLEGTPSSVAGEPATDTVELRLTGYEEGSEPAVVISSEPEDGPETEHTLQLGEHLDAGGSSWRVSEIGISGSSTQPASVTLTREPE